jgi:Zn-dependent metalloprotease
MNPFLNWFKYIIFTLLLSCSHVLQDKKNESFNSAQITMSKSGQAPSQIRFAEGKEVVLSSFWNDYSKKFNLSQYDEFKIYKTTTDKTGQTHHRCKQYYKGIEVADMQYILHEKNGMVHLANGKIIHGLDINIKPSLTESQALEKALDHLETQHSTGEKSQNKKSMSHPKGKLMISAAGKKAAVQNFRLVYRFDIYSQKPLFAYAVDVDAYNGEILNKVSLILNSGVQGK